MGETGNVSILGVGHSLGALVRGNDDPVFDYLRKHPPPNSDLFDGLKFRRVLGPNESVTTIMIAAATKALAGASLRPQNVDMLIGSGSVSEYYAPNSLSVVHQSLGLSSGCRALALNSDYTPFLDGMKIANDMITCGTIKTALVVCGINWTQHMNYMESICVAASDAAGAAVVGMSTDVSKFRLVDWANETQTTYYGALRMAPRPASAGGVTPPPPLFTEPTMKLDDVRGRGAVVNFGIPAPPRVIASLLARNKLKAGDITLVAHQTSKMVAEHWKSAIAPALYVSTLEDLADMVSASVPVNLSLAFAKIPTSHLVLLGIGMEMHVTALLYARTSPQT